MTLLQHINAILAKYDAKASLLHGPADCDDSEEADRVCLKEIIDVVAAANEAVAHVVSHAELGVPDEPMFKSAAVIGMDAHHAMVCTGDVVNHAEKSLTNGIVLGQGEDYKGEPAVVVDWGEGKRTLSRLSKLVKA